MSTSTPCRNNYIVIFNVKLSNIIKSSSEIAASASRNIRIAREVYISRGWQNQLMFTGSPFFLWLILLLTAMLPRDVPDVSNILHTKRGRKRPRPADQEHSLAPNAGSTNAGQGLSSSDSQDPVDQRLPSSSTPVTIPSTPSAVVIQGPSITTTAISGLGTMEHEEFSPTGSIVPLISETPATHQSDRGQETTTNVLNYFTTALWNQPAHQEVVGLFNPREHHETENEEGKFLINSIAAPSGST